jgi:hypothetical protein
MVQVLQGESWARSGRKSKGVVNAWGKPPTQPARKRAGRRVFMEGSRRGSSGLGGDVLSELPFEVCERHHAEIPVAPGAHRNGPACLFLVTDDKDERNLLQ